MARRFVALAFLLLTGTFAYAQCPTDVPTLSSPPSGATGVTSPVTFEWTAVPNAVGYKVWASFNGAEFDELGETEDANLVAALDPDTTVEWYVVTVFAGECTTSSGHASFTTAGCGSATATLFTPQNGGVASAPVQFAWSAVPNSTGYRLWIAAQSEDFAVYDDTETTSSVVHLSPGTYQWFVEAFFDSCDSTDSNVFTFTVEHNQNCPATPPQLVAPAEGATVSQSPVTFSWQPVSGAIGYQVWAGIDDSEPSFIDATEGATSITADIGTGDVEWYVVALFNGCDDLPSADGKFTIPYNPACDIGSPLLVSPADGDTDVPANVQFIWTPVDGATGYRLWVSANGNAAQVIGTSSDARLSATVPAGAITWFVETNFASCPTDFSPESSFTSSTSTVCTLPIAPDIYVDPEAMSDDQYTLIWSPGLNTASYELQEATNFNFTDGVSFTTSDILRVFQHSVKTATRYFYRVRSQSSCGLGAGPFSDPASMVVIPVETDADDANSVASLGQQNLVVQKIHVPGSGTSVIGKTALAGSFNITSDKPWLKVSPSTGTIPPEGIDLTVTADPKSLPAGTNTGTLQFTTTAQATGSAIPVSVSVVTPVTPNPSNSPLPNSLIIPAVAHAAGANAIFESDIRIANVSAQAMRYLLNFTPTNSDGTKNGQQATIQIDPGDTTALDDIMKNFYGYAASTDNVLGTLEIRPLAPQNGSPAPANVTFASSRTFASTATGTFGQFIPAIAYSQFIGQGKTLSLQQIADSVKFRTNVGLVEGSGAPAKVQITAFDDKHTQLGQYVVDVPAGGHVQMSRFLATRGLTNVEDGRLEIQVLSATGRITAYASVLDNQTTDPLLVLPVDVSQVNASRYILPGIGDVTSPIASWRSDIRLYNGGKTPVPINIAYSAQGDPGNLVTGAPMTIQPGEVKAIDNITQSLFGRQNTVGSVIVTAPSGSKLVATARTYDQTPSGTFGQFIPGLTPADGIGVNDRALQILQVEQSPHFHTNLGLVELTGNPVTVEINVSVPQSKVTAVAQVALQGNEFRQIGSVLAAYGYNNVYNARIALKVISGTGKVGGYASIVDERTQDPTYVMAQ